MKAKDLLSAAFTVLGAAALLAASGVLTVAVTMAALDGSWTQLIDFNDLGEGPLELALAWALLPAVGWVLRGALEREMDNLAAARMQDAEETTADDATPSISPTAEGGDPMPTTGALGPANALRGEAAGRMATSLDLAVARHRPTATEDPGHLPEALAWAQAYREQRLEGPEADEPPRPGHDAIGPDERPIGSTELR